MLLHVLLVGRAPAGPGTGPPSGAGGAKGKKRTVRKVNAADASAHHDAAGKDSKEEQVALAVVATPLDQVQQDAAKEVLWLLARAFDSVVGDEKGRETIRKGVLVDLRRCMRACHTHIPFLLDLLMAPTASSGVSATASAQLALPLIGLILDVCLRLRVGSEQAKGAPDGVGRSYVRACKPRVLQCYIAHVVASKAAVPRHVAEHALHDFFRVVISPAELAGDGSVRATLDKMLLRSPEISLPVASAVFGAVKVRDAEADAEADRKAFGGHLTSMTSGLSSALRSTNAATRDKAVALLDVLLPKVDVQTALPLFVKELTAALKSGKVASSDARGAVFDVLARVPASSSSPSTSALIIDGVGASLDKEQQETAFKSGVVALCTHTAAAFLDADQFDPVKHVPALLAKMLAHAKAPLRNAAYDAFGSLVLRTRAAPSGAWKAFVEALLPTFDGSLKNAYQGAKAPAGPLEGYVVIAMLKGKARMWDSAAVDTFVQKNETLAHLITTDIVSTNSAAAGKASFLLNDKVVRKVVSEAELFWLLHALGSLFASEADLQAINKSEDIKKAIARVLLHCAMSKHVVIKRFLPDWVRELCAHTDSFQLGASILHAAGVESLRLDQQASQTAASVHSGGAAASADGGEDPAESCKKPALASVSARIKPLLKTLCELPDVRKIPADARAEALVKLFVLTHHPRLGSRADLQSMASRLQLNLTELIEKHFVRLFTDVHAAMQTDLLTNAAYATISTLVALAPEVALAEIVSDLERQLDVTQFACISAQDLHIWRTPPGELFVDVLAQKNHANGGAGAAGTGSGANSRDSKVDKWEAELRQSLEQKKKAAKRFSKEEQALIDTQLTKESETRNKVENVRSILLRSLHTLQALMDGRTEETESYILGLVKQSIALARLPQVHQLAPLLPFEMLSAINTVVSTRLGPIASVLPAALLRSVDENIVPESFRIEAYSDVILRILYRLRFVSEQAALGLGTVSVLAPLITNIIHAGGLGVDTDDCDAVMEQVQLSLDFIVFHTEPCEDARYPRSDFVDALLHIVAKHTQLAQDAVSALRSMGEAMRMSALPFEIEKLLHHCLADEVYVRTGCLQALQSLDLLDLGFPRELWVACHDSDEENRRLALRAWSENELELPEHYHMHLITLLEHFNDFPRIATPSAIAGAADIHPESVSALITSLMALYEERNKLLLPEYDQFGMVVEGTQNREDPWKIRVAIAATFVELAQYFSSADILPFFQFLIEKEALGDRSEPARLRILDAATAVIDDHGKDQLDVLIKTLENFFEKNSRSSDGVTEAVVILLGRLARHLAPEDPRLAIAIKRLLEALHTPSELVQSAVSDCLPPLIRAIPESTPQLVDRLMDDLVAGSKYAHRRGAAYGLAGAIKGRGIASISEFKIMERLEDAARDKDQVTARQGAMFAYETLTASLKILFEPYILSILPHLLVCFGDPKEDVREATQDAARVIMQSISGHCVKLILPTLLAGLDDKQWRSKKGAIELLGAMAYCAPRQLSVSLPTVIPPLSGVLSDSHNQVKTAANKSLKQFGEVIDNPEIKKLTPKLLQALINPNDNIPKALNALLNTSFVHYIDSASLALVMPIIERGLKERGASLQRDAARIVGNLAGLTDSRDFTPYLRSLVPLVRVVLVSPVPDARAVAAKALGTLVERLGEVHFVDLIPSLLQVLRSDATGVDRQGSAQGLAEILAGLGTERMEGLLPEIINSATNAKAYVRAGYISLLIYLPATFGHRFAPHLGRIIPPILGGIADQTESVRDASMRAGRMIIANYSTKAVDLLLPELERGLFDEAWRIRMSSIQLVADLLFRISGISGKNEMAEEEGDEGENEDEDAPLPTSSVQKALGEALGDERRDRVLSAIYIIRQDPNIPVRQAAIHTWKALVLNTPRTAREVLPTMLDILIHLLSAPGAEQRELAGRTLGELVRKLGERILRDTMPILRNRGVTGEDARTRSGVCLAVTEILQSATKAQLEDHEDSIIALIRHALVDESAVVRRAAAQAFDASQEYIGTKAIDDTIPTLLEAMSDPDNPGSETALAALREVMRARADVVFPVLVPTLTVQPISAFNARALAGLVAVAGRALNQVLQTILTSLAIALEQRPDDETRQELEQAVSANLTSVTDPEGLHLLMMLLLGWAGNNTSAQRRALGCRFFEIFTNVKKSSIELSDYLVDWIRRLVALMEDPVDEVIDAARAAVEALFKSISKEDLESYVTPLRHAVEGVGALGQEIAGFCRPKGIGAFVPVFLAGLLNGTAEQREQGAYGLADLVDRTSAEAVKPFVVQMVGPLIRACGDRHAPAIKIAIFTALNTMLQRVPQHCRPFYPQLQRSFQKGVVDPISSNVRLHAGNGLGTLMEHQPRVEPVIVELLQNINAGINPGGAAVRPDASASTSANVESNAIAESAALALVKVFDQAPGKNVTTKSLEQALEVVQEAFGHAKDSLKPTVADVFAAVCVRDSALVKPILETQVLAPNPVDPQLASHCVRALLERAPAEFHAMEMHRAVLKAVLTWIGEAPAVARPARESRDMMRQKEPWRSDSFVQEHL
ncbi:ARM repeat-containing protein [Tilletiaria anomala UBC 951]|uniref:ARM repeat-containing protein n=1 Tax=Tilletiaria anomala (strain ATCC 24038 / CBS 436.72 / UBC 951) TaxID=1037660 RepID=A0A066W7K4_TILAU|nr:ARM repeat-containing protein [Tilletiaria anomala UBC 951]KDN49927.1 ARM repeat-containing protein [Tilletiaria anomala UBC 951]